MSGSTDVLSPEEYRRQWLEKRRAAVGASEVAAILGVSSFGTPLSVYNAKVLGVEAEETQPMRMGRRLEAAIADEYAHETGRDIVDPGAFTLQPHPSAPLQATLDRLVIGPDREGPLQIKSIGRRHARDWQGAEPPLEYLLQVQAEIACHGDKWGALAGWVAGDVLIHFEVPRDDQTISWMLKAVERFWEDHVLRGIPPEPTSRDRDALAKLYPQDVGTEIALPEDMLQWANFRDELSEQIDKLKQRKEFAENALKAALGSNTFGLLPDGSKIKWAVQKRKAYTVQASESRAFKRLNAPRKELTT